MMTRARWRAWRAYLVELRVPEQACGDGAVLHLAHRLERRRVHEHEPAAAVTRAGGARDDELVPRVRDDLRPVVQRGDVRARGERLARAAQVPQTHQPAQRPQHHRLLLTHEAQRAHRVPRRERGGHRLRRAVEGAVHREHLQRPVAHGHAHHRPAPVHAHRRDLALAPPPPVDLDHRLLRLLAPLGVPQTHLHTLPRSEWCASGEPGGCAARTGVLRHRRLTATR